jgi:hypothetical protein
VCEQWRGEDSEVLSLAAVKLQAALSAKLAGSVPVEAPLSSLESTGSVADF